MSRTYLIGLLEHLNKCINLIARCTLNTIRVWCELILINITPRSLQISIILLFSFYDKETENPQLSNITNDESVSCVSSLEHTSRIILCRRKVEMVILGAPVL